MQWLDDLLYGVDFLVLSFLAFVVFLGAAELGLRMGLRDRDRSESVRALMSGVGAALLGILGLLLGFTMSMAVSRWDARHDLVVAEANAIGTLWLRAGLTQEPLRDGIRSDLLAYTKARIDLASSEGSADRIDIIRAESDQLLSNIWKTVETLPPVVPNPAVLSSVISATNDLIDLNERRLSSYENHLPSTVMFLLVFIGAVAMGFIGWSFGAAYHRRRTALFILALSLVLVLSFLMDLNRPQRGAFVVGTKPFERLLTSISPTSP